MKFYLGTHIESWLSKNTDIPLFVSYRRLRRKKNFTKAKMSWALDSGGFSELSLYGKWTISPNQYAKDVARYHNEIQNLDWAAIQDYMCEPWILKKTGLTVPQHQILTCVSYVVLKSLTPEVNWIPILQGYEVDDYLRHIELYDKFKIDVYQHNTVGVGSICRRQHTNEIGDIITRLHQEKIPIHGFGVKLQGIKKYGDKLVSADSLAWSYNARYDKVLQECIDEGETHINCANCFRYATNWYSNIMSMIKGCK